MQYNIMDINIIQYNIMDTKYNQITLIECAHKHIVRLIISYRNYQETLRSTELVQMLKYLLYENVIEGESFEIRSITCVEPLYLILLLYKTSVYSRRGWE